MNVRNTKRSARLAIAVFLSVLIAEPVALADDVPPSKSAVILTRALAYDGNLKSRAGDTVVVAVLVKGGNAASDSMGKSFLAAFQAIASQLKVQGLPFKVVRLTFEGAGGLKDAIGSQGIDALFVCEGLEGDLAALQSVSQGQKIITLGGKMHMVEGGLSLGVFMIDQKPTILLNVTSSKKEGANFSAELMRLAKVIK